MEFPYVEGGYTYLCFKVRQRGDDIEYFNGLFWEM